MGMIFEALERKGELDNTLVIFASDNGFLMGEHGEFDQKRWAYEESIRVPFLARYPKLIARGQPARADVPERGPGADAAGTGGRSASPACTAARCCRCCATRARRGGSRS